MVHEQNPVHLLQMNIMDNIHSQMKQQNITQNELAQMIGVSEATVSRWFKGDRFPHYSRLRRITDILGINMGDLGYAEHTEQTDNKKELTDVSVVVGFAQLKGILRTVAEQCTAEQLDKLIYLFRRNWED